jgi:hypothetical protein
MVKVMVSPCEKKKNASTLVVSTTEKNKSIFHIWCGTLHAQLALHEKLAYQGLPHRELVKVMEERTTTW